MAPCGQWPVTGQPAGAAAGKFNCLARYDNFRTLANIDLSGTNNFGYYWYPKHAEGGGLTNAVTEPSSSFSVGPNGLTISTNTHLPGSGAQNFTGFELGTCPYTGASPPQFVNEMTFSGGGYFSIKMAFDKANAVDANHGWVGPYFWNKATMLSWINQASFVPGGEIDWYEAFATGAGAATDFAAIHDWTSLPNNSTANGNISISYPSPTYTNLNDYAVLWRTQAQTGAHGEIHRYFNSTEITQACQNSAYNDYSSGTNACPSQSPTGLFSDLDSAQMCFNLATGQNWPLTVSELQFWR